MSRFSVLRIQLLTGSRDRIIHAVVCQSETGAALNQHCGVASWILLSFSSSPVNATFFTSAAWRCQARSDGRLAWVSFKLDRISTTRPSLGWGRYLHQALLSASKTNNLITSSDACPRLVECRQRLSRENSWNTWLQPATCTCTGRLSSENQNCKLSTTGSAVNVETTVKICSRADVPISASIAIKLYYVEAKR